jgi:hypothetical protein
MSDAVPAPPPRARHVRPGAARAQMPARVRSSPGEPSPRRRLAAQVVAWHNQHPLARRIGRRDLGGYGIVGLPFSPPATGDDGRALRRFPMFDDLSLIPGLSRAKVVALALDHGWDERPGPEDWPVRRVPVAKGWDAAQTRPIYLLTVALKRGRGRPALRLLVGREAAVPTGGGAVLGHRLLSRPRMALLAGVLLAPALLVGWGLRQLWPAAMPEPPRLATAAIPADPTTVGPPADRGPPRAPGAGVGSMPPAAVLPRASLPPAVTGPAAMAPDDILPPPAALTGRGPRVGTGVPLEAPPTRAAGPTAFRLVGAPVRDPAQLKTQAAALQAALQAMGHTGGRLRMDVIGTPEGDALSIGPLPDQTEAERVARRLAARGIVLQVTEQP